MAWCIFMFSIAIFNQHWVFLGRIHQLELQVVQLSSPDLASSADTQFDLFPFSLRAFSCCVSSSSDCTRVSILGLLVFSPV